MQGKIFLNTRSGQQLKNGAYPLICELTANGQQKPFSLKMKFHIEDWDFNKQEPKKDKTRQFLIRKKKSLLDSLLLKALDDNSITINYIKSALNGKLELNETGKVDFINFGFELSKEKKEIVSSKGIKKEGNAESYITALNQLKKFKSQIDISEVDYNLLTEFKNQKLKLGNKKNTVAAYMRALRAIYNECTRRHKIKPEHNPFEGVFSGISVKKNRTKKRNLSAESIKLLESFEGNLVKGQQLAIDLFLLQFYFGGQDLTDIYHLEKKQLSKNGRVYFTRGKLDEGGYEFDLKIFNKTNILLNKFISRDNFLIPGRKDYTGYKNYRSRVNNNLDKTQKRYNEHIQLIESLTGKEYHKLELLPLGGKITTKVARHTFSTIANRKYIEPDLLRALMGHERDDVDTIYKDVYPEEERDKFHSEIIATSNIKLETKLVYQLEYFNEKNTRSWKYKYFDKQPSLKEITDQTTLKKYSQPRYFKKIYLLKKQ
ncbi:hypothetical protein CXF68_01845 [Tenacibaculum sp. Bg11-29]|uniref:tyrosine-type recombinase/integrase n=1 Tax=Tenacibaculum sp. Bg11-29 TaxID=2058306 RepID=UPI000C33B410|nr:phage integrase SAM-like domain-containing protein [Tenacibaculum sp. Bg11-29]PKH49505.1 hypothetical protein CXF68_01845 [Tenacibaculum sp. Bg11-29]